MFDIKKVKTEAEKEFAEEKIKRAKERIKEKLKQRDQARKVLANIEREIEDLYAELSEDT